MCGLGLSIYVWKNWKNAQLASGIFFFFLMEMLQSIQYFFIDQCDNRINQALTAAGYLHICLQPYFTHVINSSLTRSERLLSQYSVVKKLCLLGGVLLWIRFMMSPWTNFPVSDQCPSSEWLRGERLCTYRGTYHLAWSVPLYEATYFSMGVGVHSFLMFAPFFVLKSQMWVQGIFLAASGPILASYITPNLQEQASIWCFFSIFQIGSMVWLIRQFVVLPQHAKELKDAQSNGLTNGNGVHTNDGTPGAKQHVIKKIK